MQRYPRALQLEPNHVAHTRGRLRFSGSTSTIIFALLAQASIEARAADTVPSAAARSPDALTETWPLAIAVGGGLNASRRATGEATFLLDVPGPYLSIGYSNTGAGRRAYAEGGIWLIFSFAAGIGRYFDSAGASPWSFHLFAGLPVPLVGFGPDGARNPFSSRIAPVIFYVEPFYRPEFREGADVAHEAGLLLKVRIGLTKRQWSLPGYDFMAGVYDL